MEASIYPNRTFVTGNIPDKLRTIERIDFLQDPERSGYDFFLKIVFEKYSVGLDVALTTKQAEFLAKSILLQVEMFKQEKQS